MLLVLDTAEAPCSIALIDGDHVVDRRHELVGRGHAERLVPMLDSLLAGRRPTAIAVDCGPGSFTGLRVGIAAARALGLAWGVPVAGLSSTALIAAAHFFASDDDDDVVVTQMGGHGELFVEGFTRAGLVTTLPLASLPPDAARIAIGNRRAIGSGSGLVAAEAPAWPDAANVVLLPADRRALPVRPIYVRPPDAKPAAA